MVRLRRGGGRERARANADGDPLHRLSLGHPRRHACQEAKLRAERLHATSLVLSTPDLSLEYKRAVVTSRPAERLELLYELACAFAGRIELDELIPLVIAKCRDVLDAEGGSVLLLDAGSSPSIPTTAARRASSWSSARREAREDVSLPSSSGAAA